MEECCNGMDIGIPVMDMRRYQLWVCGTNTKKVNTLNEGYKEDGKAVGVEAISY